MRVIKVIAVSFLAGFLGEDQPAGGHSFRQSLNFNLDGAF